MNSPPKEKPGAGGANRANLETITGNVSLRDFLNAQLEEQEGG
jgi:hypothetical protein